MPRRNVAPSANQVSDHMAMHVGQSKRPPRKGEGQSFMIDAELMQDRRLDVVHVNGLFDRMESEFVGLADRLTGPNPAPRHPHAECLRMMIAAELSVPGRRWLPPSGFDRIRHPKRPMSRQASPVASDPRIRAADA